MAKPKKAATNYQALSSELDEVMVALQQENLDIDKALVAYERGLELVQQLEQYLQDAENKVKVLKVKFKRPPA